MRFCPSLFAIAFTLSTAYAQQLSADSATPSPTPTPVAGKEAPASTPATAQEHTLHVNRFVLATGVQNKEPIGEKTTFDVADRTVFAFLDVKSAENKIVTIHWKRNGHTHHAQKLTVKASPRFRTWAHVKLLPGNWTVALEDEQGKTVQELSFAVGGTVAEHNAGAHTRAEAVQKSGIKDVLTSLEPQKAPSK